LNLEAVMKLHLRCQSLWHRPPASARDLLHRVEYILGNTTVDNSPATILRRQEVQPQPQPEPRFEGPPDWKADGSGYDGWLPGIGEVT
jgi:hypothetical protein